MYGSDAVAGVINIITTKKEIDKPVNVKGNFGFGNKNTTRGSVQMYGKADKLTYTARFSKLQTDGFSSAYDSAGNKNFDNDRYDGNTVNASVQYQVSSDLQLRTFIQHNQYKTDLDNGAFSDKRDFFTKSKNLNTGGGFTFKRNTLKLTGNYQYSTVYRYYDDNASVPGATVFSTREYNGITQFAELFTDIQLNSHFTVIAGGDYRYASMNYTPFYSSFPATGFKDTLTNQYSGYASLLFNAFGGKINIEGGGRYNHHSRYGNNATYTFNPSYAITNNVRIYGSIASGFKTPTLYQLYDAFAGNQDLKAEKSTNYELGVQIQGKYISERLTGFYRDISNGIDYNYTTNKYFNFVQQKVKGLEYEIKVQPTRQLQVTANYTFISGDEQTQNRVNYKDTSYHYLLRRPKHNINLSVGYQFTESLLVSVSSKYVSKRYDIGGYDASFNSLPDISLDSYILLNAYAEYKLLQNVKFFVNAQNITNKKFFEINGLNSMPFLINGGVTFNL